MKNLKDKLHSNLFNEDANPGINQIHWEVYNKILWHVSGKPYHEPTIELGRHVCIMVHGNVLINILREMNNYQRLKPLTLWQRLKQWRNK